MKMRKTKIKFMSLLLAVMMIVGMLPTTALAAGNYPKASNVFVDGGKSFYDNRLYYKKGDQDKNFTGNEGDYIAHYNPATGTLTLNGYSGGSISVGGVGRTDITVVLKGTNIINGSLTNEVGGDITVTSSDGGTLSISKTTSGSNPAIGIETGLSASYTTGNVTITGDAKVTIDMTHNGTQGFDKAYGIFAKENITISESASVDITCATPNNTAGGGNCNGLYAAQNVIIDTNGTIKIDVTKAGKDDGYSFGVYPMGTATLTKVGEMEVQWKKHATHSGYPGGAVFKGASLSDTDYAINVDETNCYASYRKGTPYTVRVENGDLTGPGVPNKMGSGMFLVNDTVNITPYEKKSNDEMLIPFQKWTSSDVEITNPTSPSNSFTVPGKNVTVTAMHSPFVGAPVFKRTDDSKGTIAFQTAVKPDGSAEYFEYVKVGKENDPYEYRSIAPQPITASTASPYEYSVSASNYYTGGDIKHLEAGDYRMAVTLNGERYLSEKFTVNYTAPVTTYTVSFNANGGTDTMADVTGISGEYTLPANGFTAPSGKQFKAWSVGGVEKAAGDTITVNANTTVTAIWENIPVVTYTVSFAANGGTGTMADVTGVSGEYTLPANGFTAPSGKQFKAWSVDGKEKAVGDTITVTADTTVKAVWENIPARHICDIKPVAKVEPSCTEGGKEAYYKCEGCGKFYEDVLGTKEITDLASWGNIAKIAHTTKQTVTKATPTANGKIVNYCSVCKKTLSTTVIPKASSIKLKATSLTYNGKVRTPKVIVKDRTGKTLVKNTDYTVSYAKGRKYVGKYAVKITFKGKYSGTKTLYFTIKPKATSISSLKAGSKKFTVKWKKQATQTTGYQVQYSASSKFSKAKTVTVGKNTTVSKKISKLSGKKKYYVRVRTYKTVKINGKSIRIYSGWSKAKTVTTKK